MHPPGVLDDGSLRKPRGPASVDIQQFVRKAEVGTGNNYTTLHRYLNRAEH